MLETGSGNNSRLCSKFWTDENTQVTYMNKATFFSNIFESKFEFVKLEAVQLKCSQ